MDLDAMDREQYAIFMQAVIKFKNKYGIECMGPIVVAIDREDAVRDRLFKAEKATEMTDVEGGCVYARYREVMSELSPRVDIICELCIGDGRFKRDFCILALTSPRRVESILTADAASFERVCEQCKGKSKDECIEALGNLVAIDGKNYLRQVVDDTYKSYYY